MCGGATFHPWFRLPGESPFGLKSCGSYNWNADICGSASFCGSAESYDSQLSSRASYLAMRNAADGSETYCAYCGRKAFWEDGKSCPGCGATETILKPE